MYSNLSVVIGSANGWLDFSVMKGVLLKMLLVCCCFEFVFFSMCCWVCPIRRGAIVGEFCPCNKQGMHLLCSFEEQVAACRNSLTVVLFTELRWCDWKSSMMPFAADFFFIEFLVSATVVVSS